ncbi:60S ribosomal protein L24, partial [Podila verticillata]
MQEILYYLHQWRTSDSGDNFGPRNAGQHQHQFGESCQFLTNSFSLVYLLIFPRIEICAFSGAKIYPGKGKIYVRVDNRSFRFVNGKAESLFLQRKNPRKISWT